jgi:Predicted ATPase
MVYKNWYSFISYFGRSWKQGEHVTIIGPTGSGKSHLALQLIKTRSFYLLLLTKGKDKTLDKFITQNDIEVITKWPPSGFCDKVALWPRFTGVDSFETQQMVFRNAINGYRIGAKKIEGIYAEGGWTVFVDEVMYFREELHLDSELRMLWTQGRSNDISLVAGTQRPRDVPQLMLNQWSHLFVFQTADKYEIERLSAIGGNISSIIKQTVPILSRHEFLYVNRITAEAIRSKVDR